MYTKKRVLFTDADGTIRRSKSGKKFISGPDDIELIPGVCERIKKFQDNGFIICIISNQGGIAHGFKSVDTVVDEFLVTRKLMAENKVSIDTVMYCPFDEKGHVEPYNIRSLRRKPDYGMVVDVVSYYFELDILIDLNKSLFIGDRDEDKGCADGAGVKFVFIDEFLSEDFDLEAYL